MSTADNDVIDQVEGGQGDQVQGNEPSHLSMSDEDFLKMGPPAFTPSTQTEVDTTANADTTTDTEGGETAATGAKPGAQVEDDKVDDGAVEGETEAQRAQRLRDAQGRFAKESKEAAAPEGGAKVEGEKTEADGDAAKDKPVTDTAAAVNFEAEYKKLLAPFKANGRDLAVSSVDEAISLMQMGANYNKKMAALKPNLKLMKMLENAGLMSEDQIGFLIDLGKKNPAAINKLVKDSGLDPMDLDAEKAGTYKPTTRTVDDREIELDTVLDELKDSPTYTRTLDVVSNKWDAASKQTIAANPELLKVVDGHVASGIYDLISTEVERQRVFGRLKGISDLEAYRQVGDTMNARGDFNRLFQKEQPAKVEPTAPVVVPAKPKPVVDEKLNDKRRAAGSTKPAAPTTTPKDFNPLAMDDAEFSKLVNSKYL